MAHNGDGDDVEMKEEELSLTSEEEAEAKPLLDHGISSSVCKEILAVCKTGKLSVEELDDRAMDALKEFNPEDACKVIKQFCELNLKFVENKSAYLCGQMKTYRAKLRAGNVPQHVNGPDEAKLKAILDRTGYSLDVTTGQRKYGGPPPGGDPNSPGPGHEIFCGKIPKDVFEDELIPLFEKCGEIWDMRLMMDPMTGLTRGYGFITFCTKEGASEAVKQLNDHEISPGKKLKVNISIANVRLFVGNIPKNKTKDEIKEEFGKRTDGLKDVIVYSSADNQKLKNRGFAFLEYDNHKQASNAKRKLQAGHPKFWQCDIIVDWADPMAEPDEDTMSKVKVLYVRNLTSDVTEDIMKEKFGDFGTVERVKKIKDYGFVHFVERESALEAMEKMNGVMLGSMEIIVSLAKPPVENKKKDQRKRNQEMVRAMHSYDDYWFPPRMSMRRLPYPDPYYEDYYYGTDPYDDYYYSYPPMGRGSRGPRGRGGARGLPPVAYSYRWAPSTYRGRRSTRGGR